MAEAVGAKTASIEAGSLWRYGYAESLSFRFRDKLLNMENSCSSWRGHMITEGWRSTTTPSGDTTPWDTALRPPKPWSRWTEAEYPLAFLLG